MATSRVLSEVRTIGVNMDGKGIALCKYTNALSICKRSDIREEYLQSRIAVLECLPTTATILELNVWEDDPMEEVRIEIRNYFRGQGYSNVFYFVPDISKEVAIKIGFKEVEFVKNLGLGNTLMQLVLED